MKNPPWHVKLLIDSDCPLCRREAVILRRLDRGRGRLVLEDIAAPDFDPRPYERTLDEVMGTIHAALPDGRLLTGMDAFRRAYAAVGFGWLLAPTAWPIIRPLADAAYDFFARHRLRLTGRTPACSTGHCRA